MPLSDHHPSKDSSDQLVTSKEQDDRYIDLTGNLSDLQETSTLFTLNTLRLFVIALPTFREKQSIHKLSKMDCHIVTLPAMTADPAGCYRYPQGRPARNNFLKKMP